MISFKNNTLVKSSFIFFIGTIVSGFGNYLYQLFSARVLDVADFGALSSLLSLSVIFSVPAGALATLSTHTTAIFASRDDRGAIYAFLSKLSKWFLLVGFVFLILFLTIAPVVKQYLKLESLVPYYIIMSSVLVVFIVSLWRGVLPGLKKFKELSATAIFGSLGRLLLAVFFFFVIIGGINGIALAVPLSSVAVLGFLFWQLRDVRQMHTSREIKLNVFFRRFLFVFFWTMALTAIQNLDLLLVKRFFSPEEAGFYAAMSLLGKIILFVNLSVVGVMFPLSTEFYEKGDHTQHRRLVSQALQYMLMIGFAAVFVYWIFHNLIVKILFGGKYLFFANYLPWFGLIAVLLSIIQLFATYFLSVNGKRFIWLLALAPIVEIILLYGFHKSITEILAILVSVLATLCLTMFIIFVFNREVKQRINPAMSDRYSKK